MRRKSQNRTKAASRREAPRRPGPRTGWSGEAVRDQLVRAAKILFARRGLGGTSIRDIAGHSGINSSMISYYFHNKEGLYRECFQEIAHQRLRQARDILLPAVSRAQYQDRLGRMIDSLFTLYLEDRDAGLIIIREYDRTTSPAADLLRDTFDQVQKLMIDFFRRAQRHGFAEKSADPFMMASIFLGAIVSHMRMDHIHKRVHGRSLRSPRERAKLKSALVEMFSR